MFESLKKITWFLKERKYDYLVAILILMITNVIVITLPWVIGKAVDSIATKSLLQNDFIIYITAILLLSLGEYIFNFIWAYKLFKNAILIEKEYISIIMKKILSMKSPFFEKFNTGDLMTRATTNLSEIHEMMGFGVLALADGIGYGGTILLAMAVLVSWKLTLLSAFPYLILAILMNVLGKKVHEIHEENQSALADMSDIAVEAVSGIRVVRAYNMEETLRGSFDKKAEEVRKSTIKTEIVGGLLSPISRVILTLNNALAIGFGIILIRNGELTLGSLISFTLYLNQLTWPMYAIGEFINILQRGRVSIDRIDEILQSQNIEVSNKNLKLEEKINELSFENYNFKYDKSNEYNLKNINLKIKSGETLGIVGKTGSGKSTLIKQILKEYDFGSGNIMINNVDINDISTDYLMEKIGYVSQENILFSKSIRENIFFGIDVINQTEERLNSVINSADFSKDVFALPDGLETLVGERGIAVSGGQKQRISIARALIKDPEILILDDSLSAVDSKTEHRIIKNINRERRNKTNIISTHRLSAVEEADNIIVLENGEIVEQGNHDELMAKKGWYFEQYNIQKLEVEHE